MYLQNSYNTYVPPSIGWHEALAAWGPFAPLFALIIILLIAWSIAWKGLALWKSARLGSKVWFVVLLIVNTLGILEILYIYVFSKKGDASTSTEAK